MAVKAPLPSSMFLLLLLTLMSSLWPSLGSVEVDDGGDCSGGQLGSSMLPEKPFPLELIPNPPPSSPPPSPLGGDGNCHGSCSNPLLELLEKQLELHYGLLQRQKEQLNELRGLLRRFPHASDALVAAAEETLTQNPHKGTETLTLSPPKETLAETQSPETETLTLSLPKETETKTQTLALDEETLVETLTRNKGREWVGGGGITVVRNRPAWSEYFHFLAAVKVGVHVTCLHVLPHDGDDEGVGRYVTVGSESGRVYIFLSQGDLALEFSTASVSPITAMLSFPLGRNKTVVVTGHRDGSVLVHHLSEAFHGSFDDYWPTLSMELAYSLSPPPSDRASATTGSNNGSPVAAAEAGAITHLEIYRVGKMRYVLVADEQSAIRVYRENGTFFGAAKSPSKPLAFLRNANTQRLLFLTEVGAASLDLRSMTIRVGPCDGLNGSTMVAYAFDATGRSKAYGLTNNGDLVYVALLGDALNFECYVRSKKKAVGSAGGPLPLLAPHAIRGYLLLLTPTQVSVFNTTLRLGPDSPTVGGGGPRLVFTTSVDDISLPFLGVPITRATDPLIACNRERLVVIGFGDGYVGIYKSKLPIQKPLGFEAKIWTSPLFLTVILLVGAWHIFGRKREWNQLSMASPPPPPPPPPPLTTTSVTSYAARDSIRDLTSYGTPARAFPSNSSTYSSGNLRYRSTVVDPTFISPAIEPDFRPSTVEPSFLASGTLFPGPLTAEEDPLH